MSRAEHALRDVVDDFEWATSAADLALAHYAVGNPERASNLIADALGRIARIPDTKKRVAAYGDIATALSHMSAIDDGLQYLDLADAGTVDVDDVNLRADVLGKILTARARQGQAHNALDAALRMPDTEGYQGIYKALALRRIAKTMLETGDILATRKAIAGTAVGMPYFESMARSDVATAAAQSGDHVLALELLEDALVISREIEDGYFRSATLRDIAVSYHTLGMADRSQNLFAEAVTATRDAKTAQERARAMSRIATRLSDLRLFADAGSVIKDSLTVAEAVDTESLRAFTHYEIAGAAAFSGYFATAKNIANDIPEIGFGNTSSIRSATKRDIAWGLARHNRIKEAIAITATIESTRERIQAMSRIVRVIKDPSMHALPRYL